MNLSTRITIGEKASGDPAGLIKGYKDPSSSVGGFGAISDNQYKSSKIFAIEAKLNTGYKVIELIITPALTDKKLYIEMNGKTMTLDQYVVNPEVYETANDDFYDMFHAMPAGEKVDIAIDDKPIIVVKPPVPKYPILKGNILIESNKVRGNYTSMYSSNKISEQLQLDVSELLNNTSTPTGYMAMFFNGLKIPAGWLLCDGSHGTINMTDKFIMGTTSATSAGIKSGGSHDAVVPSHSHKITFIEVDHHKHNVDPGNVTSSKAGKHEHKMEKEKSGHISSPVGCQYFDTHDDRSPAFKRWDRFIGKMRGSVTVRSENTSNSGNHNHTVDPVQKTSHKSNAHSHTLKIDTIGENLTGLNKPPFFTLIYIQKT